jgi:hypothetical protein
MNDCYFEKKDWRLCRDEVRNEMQLLDLAIPIHITCMATKCEQRADDAFENIAGEF